ncbi:Flavin-dependent L-tryptophan oxidase RebO [Andreprevotia sp. IGB-42]|uniref:flavin monoamine oxidase family protein n=1 Tax=Andreprevotia sp. IGB-42 TaxID=2497473 RepID=UPI00135BCE99|nr:NAD(P)/FAD-dependent oxidoreductase [Andreprevotia sp. IGB-42]KAF0811970.1 Flavin-dependent L-tryptophan oxidase RebO [Andreprevotia sp. IGB-42]
MSSAKPIPVSAPQGTPSLRAAYQAWLNANSPRSNKPAVTASRPEGALKIGIVGAGMAGLYAALVLQENGHTCHLFEAQPDRLGGRVYTHRFNAEKNQYFEAGAMRLPDTEEQQPLFHLVDYINQKVPASKRIELIPYQLYDDTGDLVFVNGRRELSGQTMSVAFANAHPEALGFPLSPEDRNKTASQLLDEALSPFLQLLEKDFDAGFAEIVKYDNLSLFTYLTELKGWSIEKVNYVETMTSATNQFQQSFTELVIESMDFSGAQWKTIANGMDRLPNACADVIGRDHITMDAPVRKIENLPDGRVAVHYRERDVQVFDRVILALPPAAVRMIDTPQWSPTKTQGIRAMHFEPLYKIGMRFKSRFWEKVPRPANGGQSISDLPSRWCVYPSYGIGDDDAGVLLLYSWMTDAYDWLPQQEDERIRLGLRDLQTLYEGVVDVHAEFIEAFSVAWPDKWATGDAMFFPGQFRRLFNVARENEGHIYFAGEHLSVHHTWIVGAIDSALYACQQILGDTELEPLHREGAELVGNDYDYSACAAAPAPSK